MKREKVVKAAGAGALALMLATPMFAQSRNDDRRVETSRRDNGSYRENQRVNVSGRVTSFSRERDGYRVYLDRGRDAYWAGYVDRVDYRRGIIDLRDERTGRFVQVDVRDRRGRLTIDDVRRGDYVELAGAWSGGGVFDAYSIESVSNGRRY